jgi:nucleoside-diphosphate-sugar epimerase
MNKIDNKIITIFGGSGFVGQYLSKILSEEHNFIIKIVTHDVEKAEKIKTQGSPGAILISYCDIFDKTKLDECISGSNIVINLVATFKEKDKDNFTYLHSQFPEIISALAKKHNVEKFIQLSNLNIENVSTLYAKSRVLGDKAIQNFENHVILRCGLIYGEEDNFLNILYRIAKKYKILPIIGNSEIKLQPIYVVDLCKAICKICKDQESKFFGTYKIGGYEKLTLSEIYKFFEQLLNKKIYFVRSNKTLFIFITKILNFNIMFFINRLFFGSYNCPFSPEQIKLSDYNNIIENENDNLLKKLNIKTNTFFENISKYLN